ncbi:MAG: hypothetical protein M1530_01475 [Candidatus Marsarchaeota archaeon]|nr:hypothetical protein [Candidatus Marsarchaeota archaeon]
MKASFISLLAVLGLLLSMPVFAAPAINQLALNSQTRQCAEFWPGDEFTRYELPAQWKVASAEQMAGCQSLDFKSCCEKMGYSFTRLGLEGKPAGVAPQTGTDYVPFVAVLAIVAVVAIAMHARRKKK